MESCLFCKIVRGEIPCNRVYEDAEVLAFHDIHPAAPVHFMLIPKLHIASLTEIEDQHRDLLGKIMLLVPRLAQEQGCTDGFRRYQHRARRGTGGLPPAYPHYRWHGTFARDDSSPEIKE